jgi:hypothetical protein
VLGDVAPIAIPLRPVYVTYPTYAGVLEPGAVTLNAISDGVFVVVHVFPLYGDAECRALKSILPA